MLRAVHILLSDGSELDGFARELALLDAASPPEGGAPPGEGAEAKAAPGSGASANSASPAGGGAHPDGASRPGDAAFPVPESDAPFHGSLVAADGGGDGARAAAYNGGTGTTQAAEAAVTDNRGTPAALKPPENGAVVFRRATAAALTVARIRARVYRMNPRSARRGAQGSRRLKSNRIPAKTQGISRRGAVNCLTR
jgi:hypothetical protein